MLFMKKQIIIAACLLAVATGNGQTIRNNSSKSEGNFYITVSGGWSFLGPTKNIEDFMRSNGFDDTSPAGWFGGAVDHPKTLIFPGGNIQFIYFLNDKTGVTLSYGLLNNIEVDGYKSPSSGFGNYIFLKSRLHLISLAYTYQTANKMHSFSVGPAIVIHSSKDESAGNSSAKHNNVKPGVQLGYLPKLYSRKTWFVALDAHCSVSPKSEIGPFDGGETSLPKTKVSTTNLYVGLAFGLKLQ